MSTSSLNCTYITTRYKTVPFSLKKYQHLMRNCKISPSAILNCLYCARSIEVIAANVSATLSALLTRAKCFFFFKPAGILPDVDDPRKLCCGVHTPGTINAVRKTANLGIRFGMSMCIKRCRFCESRYRPARGVSGDKFAYLMVLLSRTQPIQRPCITFQFLADTDLSWLL